MPRNAKMAPDPAGKFDDPAGRARWFRHSRQMADGKLPRGLIARASAQKRRHEFALRARLAPGLPPAAPGGPGGVNWAHLGPDRVAGGLGGIVSGRVTALAVGPGGNRVYLGAANGGVWFSSDGGGTWTPLDEFAVSPTPTGKLEADALAVGAIAARFGDSASADTLYVGTGEPTGNSEGYFGIGIKVSTDGGRNFTLEGTNLAGNDIYRIVIDPVALGIVFAATTTGIYLRPAGPDFSTWTKVTDPDASNPASDVTDLVVAGSGASRVYYAATMNQVFQSSDIFKKPNGSASWAAVNGVVAGAGRKAMAAGENDTSVVYCLTAEGSLFRLDRGTSGSFQQVAGMPKALFAGGQGYYDILVEVDPSDASAVYLGGDLTWDGNWALALFKGKITGGPGSYKFPFNSANDLFRNPGPPPFNDSGKVPNDATWIGRGIHPDGHVLAFATNADGTHDATNVWVGCDGGVFQSGSSGVRGTFISKNPGLNITQMTYMSLRADTADELYSGCQDNGTLRYTASGNPPWIQTGAGDGGGVAINPGNTSQIIRQYVRASLETSADDGKTWTDQVLPAQGTIEDRRTRFYSPVKVFDAGGKTLVAFGTNRLWFRTDWSDPWITLPAGTDPAGSLTQDVLDDPSPSTDPPPGCPDCAPVTAMAFGSATMILAATGGTGAGGKVWRFDQSGGSWTPNPPKALAAIPSPPAPGFVFVTALAVEDASKGSFYAALGSGGGEHILYYDGTQWQSAGLSASTLDVPAHAVVVHPADPNTVFLGTDVGVWKGVKAGTTWTWTPFSQGLPEAAVTDLAIHVSAQKLRAATHGRGVWEIPIDWPSSASSSSSSSDSSSSSGSNGSSSDSSSSSSSDSSSSSSDSSSSSSDSASSSSDGPRAEKPRGAPRKAGKAARKGKAVSPGNHTGWPIAARK